MAERPATPRNMMNRGDPDIANSDVNVRSCTMLLGGWADDLERLGSGLVEVVRTSVISSIFVRLADLLAHLACVAPHWTVQYRDAHEAETWMFWITPISCLPFSLIVIKLSADSNE
jgi:hypothetical protein